MKLAIARTLLSLLLLPPAAVVAQSNIRIGTLTYQPSADGFTSGYYVIDGTYNLQFGSAIVYVKGAQLASGAVSSPVGLLYMGGVDPNSQQPYLLPSCVDGCVSISLQLLSPDGQPM